MCAWWPFVLLIVEAVLVEDFRLCSRLVFALDTIARLPVTRGKCATATVQ